MLFLGLMIYLLANAISYRQDSSPRWIIFTGFCSCLLFGPILVNCFGPTSAATSTSLYTSIPLFNNTLCIHSTSAFFIIAIVIVIIVSVATYNTTSTDNIVNNNEHTNSIIFLIITLSLIGTILLIIADTFPIIILSLELQSFGGYLLVAPGCLISSLKYFFWGSLASAFIVLGIGFIYLSVGFLNSFNDLYLVFNICTDDSSTLHLIIGFCLLIIGLAFKIGAAPFHFWTPIVYSSINYPLIIFLSIIPKFGALVLISNLMPANLYPIFIISALSLLIGAFGGLNASSFRVLIAYSSINHVGFILILLISISLVDFNLLDLVERNYLLLYILQYAITLTIALTIIHINNNTYSTLNKSTYNNLIGLWYSNPYFAIVLTIAILSFAGIPPSIGFYSKLIAFKLAIANGFYSLASIALFSSVLTAYFYLKIIAAIFIPLANNPTEATLCANSFLSYFISSSLALVSFYAMLG